MSASLVGSEMCIRDSSGGVDSALFCSRRCRICRRNGPASAPEALLEGAVSYTHLTLPTICSV
eukprot:14039834-Alexandrium_andersonii.AAC.1